MYMYMYMYMYVYIVHFIIALAHVYENVHERAVNKLSFHPREVTILLSGSQDSTMCCFVSFYFLQVCPV